MARWEPDARGRLEEAALELYAERGYEQTTVAEIARRAGVTERTFFRHFADKREVLFGGSEQLRDALVASVAAAPADASPLDAVAAAVADAGAFFTGRRDRVRRRQAVVDANPELQERELAKMATLAAAVAEALRERGVPEPQATLAGHVGATLFARTFEAWVAGGAGDDWDAMLAAQISALRALADAGD